MNDILLYLVKVVCVHGLVLLIYHAALKRHKAFTFSRFYLITGLLIGFVVPQMQFFEEKPETIRAWQEVYFEPFAESIAPSPAAVDRDRQLGAEIWVGHWSKILVILVCIGSLALAIRYLLRVYRLLIIAQNRNYLEHLDYKLYPWSGTHAFSFFHRIFIPAQYWEKPEFDTLLLHEVAHARHAHSADRLLIDFIIAVCWFNPFVYLFRRELIGLHEYQADETVLHNGPDKIAYQEMLFSFASQGYVNMASGVGAFSIKNRIKMMNRYKNSTKSKLGIAVALIVTPWIFLAFSGKQNQETIQASILGHPWEDLFVHYASATTDAKDQPSIFPVDLNSAYRISSEFGQRKNPWTGKMQMHLGLDVVAPIGTEVYATADGVVTEAKIDPEAWGHSVVITHEDKRFQTLYAHLQKFVVKAGDRVEQGQVIGYIGSSGRSTGPHLHYGVRKEGKYVDPSEYLPDFEIQP
ncbi:MAG: M23/M56 family metallopeptidase [Bacteroidota bacterium]